MKRLLLFLILLGLLVSIAGSALALQPAAVLVNPSFVSFNLVGAATAPTNGTVSARLILMHPDGAAQIRRFYWGFSNCTQNIGEAYASNFERNFANYFGFIYYPAYGSTSAVVNNVNAACTGGQYGEYPWDAGGQPPRSNRSGSVTVTQVTTTLSGNNLIVDFELRFTNFAAGTYSTYYMIEDQARDWHSTVGPEWWQANTITVRQPTPTATGTIPPTLTRTPTRTSTAIPTRTPTATPIPNNPPGLVSLSISPNPARVNDTVSFSARFLDQQGGATIQDYRLGISTCTVADGEGYLSNFERLLADFFGVYSFSSGITYVSAINQPSGCSGGLYGTSPWQGTTWNLAHTAGLIGATRTATGNYLDVTWTVQLANFPPGSYRTYTLVRDAGGLTQNGTTTLSYRQSPITFTVQPPPQPKITSILLGGSDSESITIPAGSSYRLRITADNQAAPMGVADSGSIVVSFPGQQSSFISYVSSTSASDTNLSYTEIAANPTFPAVQASKSHWAGGETHTLELLISPPASGAVEMLIKLVMPQGSTRYLDPLTSAYTDQQGDKAYRRLAQVDPPLSPIGRLNYYRALAGVPLVADNPAWSLGCQQHARYMVENEAISRDENPSNPWYTYNGFAAGQVSHLTGFEANFRQDWGIDLLMQSALHAIPMLNPKLTQVGYGEYQNAAKTYPNATCLDIHRGEDYDIAPTYPVFWPPANGLTPLVAYTGNAEPSPLSPCGYTAPSGAPIFVLVGDGMGQPQVSASSLRRNGASLAHCVYDADGYTHPDPSYQADGRAILDYYDAVVLIPREPLLQGMAYTVSMTIDGRVYAWNFQVAAGFVQVMDGLVR